MARIWTKSTQFAINGSLGEIINAFQGSKKKKKKKQHVVQIKELAWYVQTQVGVTVGADTMFNDPKSAIMAGHHWGVPTSTWNICYLSLPPTRQDLTQGQWPEGRLKWV